MIHKGAIDAHVHLSEISGLAYAAAAGIAALRDAGTRNGVGLRAPLPAQPRLTSAGWALTTKGGYGASFGTAVGSRQEIKAEILRLRSAGAGIIKVMASGMVSLKEPRTISPG